jgi:hypothetical protein
VTYVDTQKVTAKYNEFWQGAVLGKISELVLKLTARNFNFKV